jgi:carotenoid cleavage dioxygenase-like enzyme
MSAFDSGKQLDRFDTNSLARFDLQAGTLKSWFPGRGRALQEPVFIPLSANAAEGEGFVVSVGQNMEQSVTELYLLDARRMEELARHASVPHEPADSRRVGRPSLSAKFCGVPLSAAEGRFRRRRARLLCRM